jgi:hypothetical protein
MKRRVVRLWIMLAGILAAFNGMAMAAVLPEWPRVFLETAQVPPAGATIVSLPAGGNLQAALNAAQPGDVIELQAGATFTGNFVLPNKTGTGWIHIRSSQHASLPPPGVRVSPSHAPLMARIVTPNTAPALATAEAAHHYRLTGLEITATHAVTSSTLYNLVWVDGGAVQGSGGVGGQTSLSQVPSDIVFDRCYVHGTPTGNVRRGFALNGSRIAIVDSHLSDFHELSADSQAIVGWNGPGPFKIANNHLEGAGENLMFGGASPRIQNLVPSDIEIRGNHFFKPLTWKAGHPSYAGYDWSVKNLFELKNARRVLVEGNVLENSWQDDQNGIAVLFTVRNDDGSANWSTVEDVTFRKNILRHAAGGFNIHATDNNFPSQQTRRILIEDNVLEDISSANWGGTGRLFQLVNYPSPRAGIADLTIRHNTGFSNRANTVPGYSADAVHTGFAFTDNIVAKTTYGFAGASNLTALLTNPNMGEGALILQTFFVTPLFTGNVLTGSSPAVYGGYAENAFPLTETDIGFVDLAGGNYRLSSSSPYRGTATGGKDPGADIDAVSAATCSPVAALPGEVRDLLFLSDGRTLTWEAEPLADRYDVLAGSLPDLAVARDLRGASCLADDTSSMVDDPVSPLPGQARYYLVRGQAGPPSDCRRGTYGSTLYDITGSACR